MTRSEKILFSLDIILVAIMGFLQSSSLMSFYGIKINISMVFLIVLIFSVKNYWQYSILLLVSLISLKYFSAPSKELVIFGLLMFFAFNFRKMFSEHKLFSITILVILLTPIYYLFIDYKFVFTDFNIFIKEMVLNMVIAAIFGYLYQHKAYEKI